MSSRAGPLPALEEADRLRLPRALIRGLRESFATLRPDRGLSPPGRWPCSAHWPMQEMNSSLMNASSCSAKTVWLSGGRTRSSNRRLGFVLLLWLSHRVSRPARCRRAATRVIWCCVPVLGRLPLNVISHWVYWPESSPFQVSEFTGQLPTWVAIMPPPQISEGPEMVAWTHWL